MLFYHRSVEATYTELRTNADGISRQEAIRRVKSYGLNKLEVKGEPLWRKLAEPFMNVFTVVLLTAATISLIDGELFDAIIISVIILISAVIYYVQRFSTDRILRSLQKHASQKIEVIRNGESMQIDDSLLVPGDIVQLNEGDKIPADIRLSVGNNVRVDESVLTGESVPVSKQIEALGKDKPIYEQTNMLFQGAFIVAGQATGIVVATGNDTEFGRIATLSTKRKSSTTSPVQKKINRLITQIVAAVGALAVVAFGLAILRGIEVAEALRFVMALSVSAVPESLPVAISVILVLGMRRMAAKKALVRSMRAIETIGVITTIATDKTGTLTENKLSVQEVWQPEGAKHHLPTVAHRTINHHSERTRDPLDIAMIEFTTAEELIELKGESIAKLPFDQAVSMSGNVWHHEGKYELVVKGAPERILDKSRLTKYQHKQAEEALQSLTSTGYRVIALAKIPISKTLSGFHELSPSTKFEFVGFMAVADTLRPAARKAIIAAQNAGVSVRMITGDHFETAYHIGKQMSLIESKDQVFDSRLMDEMNDHQLTEHIQRARVFSRVTPENKYRILEILKAKEITAMTGDGVNDVPALSNAHVGIAMGSGSQIAKDAGGIILLNDSFASIVHAMREGRIIFANIRRMLYYLLSTNIGQVIALVGSIAIGLPLPLAPVQILWINLVTDTAMVIPLGLEPGEKDAMRKKPLPPNAPLLSKYLIGRIVLVASVMSALTIGLYMYFLANFETGYAQTIAFCALVVMQWANAFNARSTYESIFTRIKVRSRLFMIGLGASVILQFVALSGPMQGLLHITPVAFSDLLITGIISFAAIIAVAELHKWFGRRYIKNPME